MYKKFRDDIEKMKSSRTTLNKLKLKIQGSHYTSSENSKTISLKARVLNKVMKVILGILKCEI